jgi:hypothetical protein
VTADYQPVDNHMVHFFPLEAKMAAYVAIEMQIRPRALAGVCICVARDARDFLQIRPPVIDRVAAISLVATHETDKSTEA